MPRQRRTRQTVLQDVAGDGLALAMTRRRTPKWLINPEWQEEPATKERFLERLRETCHLAWTPDNPFNGLDAYYAEREVYFPEEFGKDLELAGNWICIKRYLPTEVQVRPLSIFYALPYTGHPAPKFGYPRHYARVLTPDGEVWVHPYEYFVVKDIAQWVGEEGVTVRWLNPDAAPSDATIFYIMSRGISKRDALLMVIGELKSRNVLYLELDDAYLEYFGLRIPGAVVHDTVEDGGLGAGAGGEIPEPDSESL